MAYALAQGDIIQVTVSYFQQNVVEMQNTFHYRMAAPTTIANGEAALNLLINQFFEETTSTHWPNAWAGVSSTSVAVSKIKAQRIFPLRNVPLIALRDVPGIVVSTAFPGVLQWSITERGDFAGKGKTGGIRIPGLPETAVLDGRLTPAFQTAAVTLRSFVTTTKTTVGGEAATWVPIIFNRTLPATSQDITSATIQESVRAQRTRIIFRGI